MKSSGLKKRVRLLLFAALCVGGTAWTIQSWKYWKEITNDRVVAQATMPNGVEIRIDQTFTWSAEMFNTSFNYRVPGRPWVWRYYSHEDGYWKRGRVDLDESSRTATVYRDGERTIEFNWETLAHTQFTGTQDGSPVTFAPEADFRATSEQPD